MPILFDGKRVTAIRKARGLTQEVVVAHCNHLRTLHPEAYGSCLFRQAQLSKIERTEGGKVAGALLPMIADALGLSSPGPFFVKTED